jgi:hypothetical protein
VDKYVDDVDRTMNMQKNARNIYAYGALIVSAQKQTF